MLICIVHSIFTGGPLKETNASPPTRSGVNLFTAAVGQFMAIHMYYITRLVMENSVLNVMDLIQYQPIAGLMFAQFSGTTGCSYWA